MTRTARSTYSTPRHGTGRRALAETGRLLHVIRDSADELGLAPVPGLADLPDLLAGFRERGLRVDLATSGELPDLPAGVDVSAYRIVQEALTNAHRYSSDGAVELTVGATPGEVTISARNSASGGAGQGSGLGLAGMAERVALLGGSIETRARRGLLRPRGGTAGGGRGERGRAGMTTVVVADDQDLVRSGIEMLLVSRGVDVLATAPNGRAAVEETLRHQPDVVLMDIRMPVLDGIAATREIVASGCPSRVLVLTTYDVDRYVYDALRAGAAGFLLKATPPDRLVEGVLTVAAGEALLAPQLMRRLIEDHVRRPPPEQGLPPQLASAHRPRARGVRADRRRAVERRDRRPVGGVGGNREDPREPGDGQAGRPLPGAAGGARL